ncbi:MAG: hypothetical protein IPN66_05675 [Candidatus Competibacteraceae bacterium]|nr:hypothetical protein [Candidatus Competibacteraceae bacterium]MBK7542915.1 hypothetical protein [Candidatus Competibacteraceae bacterium]MBK8896708.1 hypothetical protein [Candidatus Competibacteraceae bacterium]
MKLNRHYHETNEVYAERCNRHLSRMMKEAHRAARLSVARFGGSYQVSFSAALKVAHEDLETLFEANGLNDKDPIVRDGKILYGKFYSTDTIKAGNAKQAAKKARQYSAWRNSCGRRAA